MKKKYISKKSKQKSKPLSAKQIRERSERESREVSKAIHEYKMEKRDRDHQRFKDELDWKDIKTSMAALKKRKKKYTSKKSKGEG